MNHYSEESFYATEISLETFFLAAWLDFFSNKNEKKSKKKKNQAKYEIFLPKPLTLPLFWWRLKCVAVLKGLNALANMNVFSLELNVAMES